MFNSMLYTKTFPSKLKTSKIIPIKKHGTDPKLLKSYRPISMLPSTEKIVEELLRNQLNKYFKDEKLIPKEHHGGIEGHSTVTCMTNIDLDHKFTKENKRNTAILATDLQHSTLSITVY